MRLLETWHAGRCNQTDASRIAGHQSVLQKVLHAAWHTACSYHRRDRTMGWQTRINILMAISRERKREIFWIINANFLPFVLSAADISRKIREKCAGFAENGRDNKHLETREEAVKIFTFNDPGFRKCFNNFLCERVGIFMSTFSREVSWIFKEFRNKVTSELTWRVVFVAE